MTSIPPKSGKKPLSDRQPRRSNRRGRVFTRQRGDQKGTEPENPAFHQVRRPGDAGRAESRARRFFDTPLLFSIQEAKGLEYENVILWKFISGERANYQAIVAGIEPAALEGELAAYARARDKTDKSVEVYKFFINALYVAITRAVRNLYLIESDTRHPLLDLPGLKEARAPLEVIAQQSSLEQW